MSKVQYTTRWRDPHANKVEKVLRTGSSFDMDRGDESEGVRVALQVSSAGGKRTVGAAVLCRCAQLAESSAATSDDADAVSLEGLTDNGWSLEIYEFLDNEHLSNLDTFLCQVGSCQVFAADDLQEADKGFGKKFNTLTEFRDVVVQVQHRRHDHHHAHLSMAITQQHPQHTQPTHTPFGQARRRRWSNSSTQSPPLSPIITRR